MSDDVVNIEVDGKPVAAKKGQMVIAVTDQIGAYIPRFCYHEKLSIAANCRMCLVEIEKAPKPMPACATPVGEGMKIFTRSPKAIAAQKATMEFLLINHPLDCPICDQGGECELQDLAMGYARMTANCSWNTASRKACCSTIVRSKAPVSTPPKVLACARWRAKPKATPMAPSCPPTPSAAPATR
jgi:NADH dehydrogenase/NADH:ubiquinone oxidoreductase subunit G